MVSSSKYISNSLSTDLPDVEEQELDDALKEAEELELEKLQEAKRKKKKTLKERRKLNEKINLKMIIKDDEPIIEEDRELFNLSQIKDKKDLTRIEDDDCLEFDIDPQTEFEDDVTKGGYRSSYATYDRYNDYHEDNEETQEKSGSSDEEMEKEIEFESDDDLSGDEESGSCVEGKSNPLVVDLVSRSDRVKDTVTKWFDKDDFANIAEDNDLELALLAENLDKKKKAKKGKKLCEPVDKIPAIDDVNAEEKETPSEQLDQAEAITKPETKKKKKRVRLDPEGLALGALMVQSKKMKRDIINDAYNRYASNDENLPDWFIKDEEKHYRKPLPVTTEMISEYKERLREINARPIKKVIEAKARKKRKSLKRMEKARKRAEAITENLDMSEKEKTEQLKSIYKKAQPKKDTNVTYVVAKKGAGKRMRRPPGVKGRFKVVDKRMKKDDRVQKQFSKKQAKTNFKKNKRNKR